MLCTTCERAVPDDAQYCAGCGTALAVGNETPNTLLTSPAARGSRPAVPQVNVTVNAVASATPAPVIVLADRAAGPGCLVRGLYFVLVGWWLSQLWILCRGRV